MSDQENQPTVDHSESENTQNASHEQQATEPQPDTEIKNDEVKPSEEQAPVTTEEPSKTQTEVEQTEVKTEIDTTELKMEDTKRTLNSSLGRAFLAEMSSNKAQRPEMNVEQSWKNEEALSVDERRARYHAAKYYTKDDLKPWSTTGFDTYSQPSTMERNAIYKPNGTINKKVAVFQGDITSLELDAVVNAANETLLGGGGIDGAIHKAAGPLLVEECRTFHGCQTGSAKITRGYNLPAKYVIHAVGPMDGNAQNLRSAYSACLDLVVKHEIKTVAFCGISTGIFGFPLVDATEIALDTVRKWLETGNNSDRVELVVFCTFKDKEMECYQKLAPKYFPLERPVSEEEIKKEEEKQQVDEEKAKAEEAKRMREAEEKRAARATEYMKKKEDTEADKKRNKDAEFKKQRDAIEKRIREETEAKQRNDAIAKQKAQQERKKQRPPKETPKKETPKPVTLSSSTASMYNVAPTPSVQAKEIVKKADATVNTQNPDEVPWHYVIGIPALLVGFIALKLIQNRM